MLLQRDDPCYWLVVCLLLLLMGFHVLRRTVIMDSGELGGQAKGSTIYTNLF